MSFRRKRPNKRKLIRRQMQCPSTKIQLPNGVPVLAWLSARYLLRTLDADVVVSCFDEIIATFDGRKEIIGHLARAANTEQLKNIVQILKSAQLKHIENNKNTIMINYNNNNSYFDYLSNESILNICQFLNRKDMKQFKMTSTLMSLNVFEIMKLESISTINMNELLIHNQYKYPLYLNIQKHLKTHKVKPFTTCRSLLHMYSKTYNIPTKNTIMLCFGSTFDKCKIVFENNKFSQDQISKCAAFYVFDTRTVLNLDNTNKLKMINSDLKPMIFDSLYGYRMVLLQYFDLHQQRIQNIQFIWLHSAITTAQMETYIINHLYSIYTKINNIYNCNTSLEWCNKLLYTVNKMKQFGSHPDTSVLNFYHQRHKRFGYVKCSNFTNATYDFEVIVFELNHSHPYFTLDGISSFVSEMNKPNICIPFYETVHLYVTDQNRMEKLTANCVTEKSLFLKQMKYFNETYVSDSIQMNMQLSKTPLMTLEMVRRQISNKFNWTIPVKHIHLLERYQPKWCQKLILNGVKAPIIYDWEIVPYDVDVMNAKNGKLCDVEIYFYDRNASNINKYLDTFTSPPKPMISFMIKYANFETISVEEKKNDNPLAFSWNSNKKKDRYKWKFKVNRFIEYAMDMVSHPMYGDQYHEMLNKFKDESYDVILMNKGNCDEKFRCFDKNDEYENYESHRTVCVGIIPMIYMKYDNGENIDEKDKENEELLCIVVRFFKDSVFVSEEIGYPMKVYITSKCTVQSVLDECAPDNYNWSKEFVSCLSTLGDLEIGDIICDKVDKTAATIELLIVIK